MRQEAQTPCRKNGTKLESDLHLSSKQNKLFSFKFSEDVDNDCGIMAECKWEGVYGHLNYSS